ncbi:MAG: MATE family efflux transporter, partial [Pseudomonadota bacterium]
MSEQPADKRPGVHASAAHADGSESADGIITSAAQPSLTGASKTTRKPGKFVTGSLRRHILVMTGTSAVGLMAIFLGDLANILFISMLGDTALVAAIGYASSIVFVMISVGIGLAIGAAALISPELGRGNHDLARRYAIHALIMAAAISAAFALVVWIFAPTLLRMLGADGRTLDEATVYVRILLASSPMLAIGMSCAAILRSVGDAQRAMYVTLVGALVNITLDPILIFVFGLDLVGAACASVTARAAVMLTGLYGVVRVHDLVGKPQPACLPTDAGRLIHVSGPAMATNLATPFANAYITASIAAYGDAAVAGWAIVGRVQPVAFGAIFALSGAIGPIIGQNYGAGAGSRMREALVEGVRISAVFTALAWVLLAASATLIVDGFKAADDSARLIYLFCYYLAPLFVFLGLLFVSNAALNTLGRPTASTVLNWGRATLGTIPFVSIGGALAGADGVIIGWMVGG